MQSTKLTTDSTPVESVPYRIPFHATLPIVVVCEPILSALSHDILGNHARAGTELIRAHMWPFLVWRPPFDDHAHPPRIFH